MDEEDLSKARRRWVRRFDANAVTNERWSLRRDRGVRHRCAKRRKGQPKCGYGGCYNHCVRGAVLSRLDARRYCAVSKRLEANAREELRELSKHSPIEEGRGRWRE